jgi:hypothetical protein
MPVTDEQEATLHAQLAGKLEEHQRLLDGLDPVAARTGYSALVSAAFTVAVIDHFPEGTPEAEVIEYVGDVRARTEGAANIDPTLAERLILSVTRDGELGDIDPRASLQAQLILLAALIADASPDEAALDRFMARARRLADRWLA